MTVLSRHPHVLLTADEVEAAVTDLKSEPLVVIDLETTKARPRSNELRWVGLGAAGRIYLIPTKHPKGLLLKPERRVKLPACLAYPNDDRGLTPLGKPSNRMVEVTLPAEYARPSDQLRPHEVCEIIRPLLWSDTALLGHHVKFDLMSLAKYYDDEIPPGPYHDTLILAHCLDENKTQYDLKTLTCDWFEIGVRSDGWVDHKLRQRWYPDLGDKGTDNFSLDEVARYLAKDLRYCWLRFQSYHKMLEKRGVKDTYDFEMSLYPVVMDMEYTGFPVDPDKRQDVADWLAGEQQRVRMTAADIAGDEFDLNLLEKKRWVLFGYGNVPQYGKSKMRNLKTQDHKVINRTKVDRLPQVTQAVLEGLADKGDPMAAALLEWSTLEKLRGTFVGEPATIKVVDVFDRKTQRYHKEEREVEPTGIYKFLYYPRGGGLPTVHTSFKQHGTVTGAALGQRAQPPAAPSEATAHP